MKKTKLDTRIHLVQELEKLPRTPEIDFIISEAKAGEYHDYKNEKYACGKVECVGKLRAIGLNDLAERVINGDFDEEADQDDINNMRSFAPKELWNVLGLDKDLGRG